MKLKGIITNTIWAHSYVKSWKKKLIETDSGFLVARSRGLGEMVEGGQKVETFNYNMDKFCRFNA